MKNVDYTTLLNTKPEELRTIQKKNGWALYGIGTVVYAVLIVCGYRPQMYHNICPYFEIGKNWGGVNMGWFFICAHDMPDTLKNHEVGHGMQNAGIGGLQMLGLCACSMARYWWRAITKPATPYDSWWFEGQATSLGNQYVDKQRSESHV